VARIARETGISRYTLIRHFRQTGIPLPSEDRRTARRDSACRRRHLEGKAASVVRVSRRFGSPVSESEWLGYRPMFMGEFRPCGPQEF